TMSSFCSLTCFFQFGVSGSRNCFQAANFYPDDPASPKVLSAPSTPLLLSTDCHEPLTVKQFVKHVLELHSTNTFSREFEEVQACTVDMGITADSSNHPDNKNKNRYINILAYDHSRVKLSNSLDRNGKCGDYINANFVDVSDFLIRIYTRGAQSGSSRAGILRVLVLSLVVPTTFSACQHFIKPLIVFFSSFYPLQQSSKPSVSLFLHIFQEQYVFIHDTLVEAILSRDTSVTSDLLHNYVSDLLIPSATGRTRMDKQFKLISQRQAKYADYSTALKDGNAERNRARALMPVERSRVSLGASESNSTGYINASYVTGHHCCKDFIVSQTPLSSTVEDFWRMIWEHNTHTVICLPDTNNQNEKRDCCVHWPSKDLPLRFDTFTVSHTGEELVHLTNDERVFVQDFTMQSSQNDCILHVRQYSTPCWPNPDSPIRNSFDLISIVRERSRHSQEPVVVHDPLGGATSGLFCALSTLFSQLEEEGAVDVYMVARMTNLMRPGVFNDIEQYQYLYRAMLSLVSSQEDQRALQSPETNGSVPLGQSNATESLESLM
uniref:protein-tyrosine-phosphatase n=1 Tax=Xiphophorus couchianus TaxID=32473 RepID=A0A3B5KR58_9TELE